jgi:glycogen(starch) synthase
VRVLILSWEYPPVVEGGLARHVRKLAEALVGEHDDLEVHVLTRAGEHGPVDEVRRGVHVHRVREPQYPRALPEFVAWVQRMNADLLERGRELAEELRFDLVHGHDCSSPSCGHPFRPAIRAAGLIARATDGSDGD